MQGALWERKLRIASICEWKRLSGTIRQEKVSAKTFRITLKNWRHYPSDKVKCLFEDWNTQLPLVTTFKIQRSILNERLVDCSHELHVFADASRSAMCAVEYFRSDECGTVVVSFLVAKCRVVPIRAITIPKCEHHAAVFGVLLTKSIQSFFSFQCPKLFLLERQLHCFSMDFVVWQTSSCFSCHLCGRNHWRY